MPTNNSVLSFLCFSPRNRNKAVEIHKNFIKGIWQSVFNAYPFTHLRSLWLFPYFLTEVQVIIYGIMELLLNVFDAPC